MANIDDDVGFAGIGVDVMNNSLPLNDIRIRARIVPHAYSQYSAKMSLVIEALIEVSQSIPTGKIELVLVATKPVLVFGMSHPALKYLIESGQLRHFRSLISIVISSGLNKKARPTVIDKRLWFQVSLNFNRCRSEQS